jgi:hypothetical protein
LPEKFTAESAEAAEVNYSNGKLDNLVKIRHSRAGGNPESAKLMKRLDPRFHRGNDGKEQFQTFYGFIKLQKLIF